ncbi:hypothetical protein KS4_23210 [Poriferisphaera corsica]|uniref:Uncharacterized protein n=1 Tax=Poriferisphaera corsica TaxID=2528020 RepID=A0A517YVJ9_9BACT|nr:hypothetical protein [Poriferisphaera corsica]QDU34255.1 hypothetical protein KS4_23210 [Poriferisphaera corsica]
MFNTIHKETHHHHNTTNVEQAGVHDAARLYRDMKDEVEANVMCQKLIGQEARIAMFECMDIGLELKISFGIKLNNQSLVGLSSLGRCEYEMIRGGLNKSEEAKRTVDRILNEITEPIRDALLTELVEMLGIKGE